MSLGYSLRDSLSSRASKSAIEAKSPRFKNRRPNTLNHSSTWLSQDPCDRGEMEHMLVSRVRQKGSPLFSRAASSAATNGTSHSLSDDAADFQAPVRVEVIHTQSQPLICVNRPVHMAQVCAKSTLVRVGPRSPMTSPVGHDKRGDQKRVSHIGCSPCSRRSGLPGSAGCVGSGRPNACIPVFSSQQITNRPCWYIVGASMYNLQICLSLGVEVGVVAVEPVDTPVRFQVGLVKNPPDRRPAHGLVMSIPVDQGSGQVIQRPPGGRTILLCRSCCWPERSHRAVPRGKISAVDPTAELILQTGQSVHQVAVSPHRRRCGDHTETQRRSGGCRDGPRRQPEELVGSERPRPEVWNRPAPRPRVGHAVDRSDE